MKTIKQFYKLLGIKDITTRMIPGEDKNIPFSRYDQILVTTITYISGETKNEYKYYRNISNSYNKIYEILFKTFGYVNFNDDWESKGYVNFNDDWESKGYYFKKDGFPLIKIEINNLHPNLFRVSLGYAYDSSFY